MLTRLPTLLCPQLAAGHEEDERASQGLLLMRLPGAGPLRHQRGRHQRVIASAGSTSDRRRAGRPRARPAYRLRFWLEF